VVNFGNSKIGRRIVVLVFVSVILSVVTLTGAFLVLQLHGTIEARKAGIQATGYVFASAIADHVAARDQQEALKVLRSIGRIPDIAYHYSCILVCLLNLWATMIREIMDGGSID